ncbi:platelet-activating factor acetylhydrolase [Pseudoscourfieldia marina]
MMRSTRGGALCCVRACRARTFKPSPSRHAFSPSRHVASAILEDVAVMVATASSLAASVRLTAYALVRGFPNSMCADLPARRENGTKATSEVAERHVQLAGLRTRVFYPAADDGTEGQRRYTQYTSELVANAMADLVFLPHFLMSHLASAEAKSGCVDGDEGARMSDEDVRKCPVLLYSHGFGGNADMATLMMRQVAAQGIVVAAVEHTDGSATVHFDSRRARSSLDKRVDELVRAGQEVSSGALHATISDVSGVTPRVFVGGHSYGAPTAILACRRAPSLFEGAILHDPAISPGSDAAAAGLNVHAQLLMGDGYAASPVIREGVRSTLRASDASCRNNIGVWHVRGAEHGNFVDAPLWAQTFVMRNLPFIPAAGAANPVEVHAAIARAASRLAYASTSSASASYLDDEPLLERLE